MINFKHSIILKPRYYDMDSFGHINNARYLTYCEEARIKYFEDLVNWKYDWSKQGVIVARAEIDYIVPANFRDELKIYTACTRLGSKSFDIDYKIIKMSIDSEIVVATARTILVAFDYTTNNSIVIPDEWKSVIKKFEGLD